MKRVEIITRPYKLDEIKEALTGTGIQGMTVTDVRGFGRQRGHKEVYRGAEYQVDFVSKVKIEIVIDDDLLDQTLEVIQQAAKTGKIGDGKIFVSSIDNAIRIRTGETGASAAKTGAPSAALYCHEHRNLTPGPGSLPQCGRGPGPFSCLVFRTHGRLGPRGLRRPSFSPWQYAGSGPWRLWPGRAFSFFRH